MSEILSAEDFEEYLRDLTNGINLDWVDEKWVQERIAFFVAHDAALRQRLAEAERERDSAQSSLAVRIGMRRELETLLGVRDTTDPDAFEDGLIRLRELIETEKEVLASESRALAAEAELARSADTLTEHNHQWSERCERAEARVAELEREVSLVAQQVIDWSKMEREARDRGAELEADRDFQTRARHAAERATEMHAERIKELEAALREIAGDPYRCYESDGVPCAKAATPAEDLCDACVARAALAGGGE